MPEPDSPSSPREDDAGNRNLPVPVSVTEHPRDTAGNWLARVLKAMFSWKAGSLRADLEVVLEAGTPGDTGFSPEESAMLKNILKLRERRIEDVMLPRADIVAVQQDIPLGELVRVVEGAGHSRLVVYNDTLDDPIGMIHIRDLIAFMTARAAIDPKLNEQRDTPHPANLDLSAVDLSVPLVATKLVREILFVPPSMPAIDLLAKMQATRIHLALVIDEYGGTDGLISIEDLVELIVGDIADEHDLDEKPDVTRQLDGSFIADARTFLEDVTAAVGEDFDVAEAAEDVDTLAGYLVTKVGRLPVRGELVPGPAGYEIEILDADPRRVKKVRIYRTKDRKVPRDPRRRAPVGDAGTPGETADAAARAPATADDPSNPAAPP